MAERTPIQMFSLLLASLIAGAAAGRTDALSLAAANRAALHALVRQLATREDATSSGASSSPSALERLCDGVRAPWPPRSAAPRALPAPHVALRTRTSARAS